MTRKYINVNNVKRETSDKQTYVVFSEKYLNFEIAFKAKANFCNAAHFCFNHSLVFRCDHHFISSLKTAVKNISHYFLVLFVEPGYAYHVIAHF